MSQHSLVQIEPSEWKCLLKLYADKRTQSTGYYLIENYIQWLKNEPDLDIKCLSLDGDWRTDGTFIIIVNNCANHKDVFFNTLDNDLTRLTKALNLLTFEIGEFRFYGYAEHLTRAVQDFKRKFDETLKLPLTPCVMYRATKEIVNNFTIEPPTGITLHSLNIEDATTINDIWPHRSVGTIDFVKRMIRHNASIGAYDADGKLVAWCLRLPLGSLGLLQVLDSHKRLGLGSLMVRCLSKEICELGGEVLAGVVVENTPSRKMFEKLGFQPIDKIYWAF